MSISTITGAIGDPFDSLYDALEKAYELGAPYTGATVTILMKPGSHHHMLRAPYGMYIGTASEPN